MRNIEAAIAILISLTAWQSVNAGIMFGTAPFVPGTNSDLYRINEQTGAATLIGSTNFAEIGGLAFNSAGVLYGYTPGALYTINTSTGAATRVGLLGMNAPEGGLAFQPGTGTLFAVSSTLTDTLLTINPSTGVATTVGPLGSAGRDTSGLAFSAAGVLYGVAYRDTNADSLITINTTTGAATIIGPTGTNVTAPVVGGLEFDPDSGILYFSDNASLYTVNTATGLATLIGPHGFTGMAGLAATVPEPASVSLIAITIALLSSRSFSRVARDARQRVSQSTQLA